MVDTINEMQNFEFEGSELKTVMLQNLAWFVGNDVAKILGYKNPRDAVNKKVETEDKLRMQIAYAGQNRNMTVINESGLYSLILSSKLDSAKKFKHWVTSVVLPTIRKTGSFNLTNENKDSYMIEDPVERAKRWIQEKEQMLELESSNKEMKPKADFVDAIETSNDVISVNSLSKLISNKVENIGQNRLFNWLRNNSYLGKRKGSDWNLPTQKSINLNVMEVKENEYRDFYGNVRVNKTTKITTKGQRYFVNKFINQRSLQIIE